MTLSLHVPNRAWSSLLAAIFVLLVLQADSFAGAAWRTPSGIPSTEIASRINELVAKHIGVTTPGAVIVIVKDGGIDFSKGYGYADVENRIEVDPATTVFEYGSISKLFVYATFMRLAEVGLLDLNADIRSFLPEGFLKRLRYDAPITFYHVMDHTAGFEDYLFDLVHAFPNKFPSLEQALLNSQPAQVYRPGTVSAYSNYAVALAAYIAQQLIGKEFFAYLRDTIFTPLAMHHTSAHPLLADHPAMLQQKAIGYDSRPAMRFKKGFWSHIPLYPAGAVNGTAEDLARFAIALMPPDGEESPLFQKRDTLDTMLSRSPVSSELSGFAHGFILSKDNRGALGHGGNTAFLHLS